MERTDQQNKTNAALTCHGNRRSDVSSTMIEHHVSWESPLNHLNRKQHDKTLSTRCANE
jgi:hypothetical protein